MAAEVCSITLAAGAGARMPADAPPKPCCKIGPVSVIENALQTYEEAGILRHVVVVGARAEDVMAEVCRNRQDVLFAFQPRRRGTGDAVRCAVELLTSVGEPEHVLICAGDKVVASRVVRGMLETYLASDDQLCLLAGPSADHPNSGRLITRGEHVRAVIEVPDIQVGILARALRGLGRDERPPTVGRFKAFAAAYVGNVAKLGAYLPGLADALARADEAELDWDQVEEALAAVPTQFVLGDEAILLEEAATAPLANLSAYVGEFGALRDAVRKLDTDNVQQECYLTDVVGVMASRGLRVGMFRIGDQDEAMAFNTPEELEQVRNVHAVRTQARVRYPSVAQWQSYLSARGPADDLALTALRGLAEKIGGERRGIVVRSPGRINLMGRHIDHQGGRSNLMAINREVVLAASPRDDDRINLWNADPETYPDRSFTFGEITADLLWEDWLRTLDSQYLQRMVSGSAGDWANYARGAALRLQHRFRRRRLKGMDALVCGNIPVAAGLSSSSALVTAVAEALTELNALNVYAKELVDLCGEGEWFVGTRGGSGDHAAIKFGRAKEVITVSFFPFEIVGRHPFPEDHALLVCHSGLSAGETESTRERFNARIACYHLAREVLRRDRPRFAPLIRYLRDINVGTLGISLPALYALIRQLPNALAPDEVAALADEHETVAKVVGALGPGAHDFALRDVALYGIAECERSRMTGDLLDRGDMAALGRTMNISHDGDRVARWREGQEEAFDSHATEERLESLAERAGSIEPLTDLGAALWQQPGAYDCSTPEIDLMVDRVLGCPGVLGAQLAGAGLGGCIMVLARKTALEEAQNALLSSYYEPAGVEPRMFVCEPSSGSRVLTTIESSPQT